MPLTPGTRLGPYEILAPIGAGGMGEVYRARDSRLGREVALKILPDSFARDTDRLHRFEQEARAVAALNHPNILAIHDIGEQNGAPYIVSELLDGNSLRAELETSAIPPRKAADYGIQIAQGLAAAHEKAIVHRDLKPENIFICRDGRVKILDFGLAKLAANPASGSAAEGATFTQAHSPTQPGVVMGTAGYMSPEQVRGAAVDARTDIFAFGAVLYEMLAGRRAFQRDTAAETMTAILKEDPPEISDLTHPVPPGMERIVRRCLEKQPEQRFQSAKDLAFALEALSGTTGSKSAPAAAIAAAPPKRNWLAPVLAALAGMAVVAAVAYFLRPAQADPLAFNRVSYDRGEVISARFAPDGKSVIFTGRLNNAPLDLYIVRGDYPESAPVGLHGAVLAGVSRQGQMAVLLRPRYFSHFQWFGTLAVAPIGGGGARELLENVGSADWSADGSEMAVISAGNGQYSLQYPIGKIILQSSDWLSDARISPDGEHIALLRHTLVGDDRGDVIVTDRSGKVTKLSGPWESLEGLAWAPSGNEVWFSSATQGEQYCIRAATLAGKQRTIYCGTSPTVIRDVDSTGRMLVASEEKREEIGEAQHSSDEIRDLSYLNEANLPIAAQDGSKILFTDSGEASGNTYVVYVRNTDGSAPVRIGTGGLGTDISPDGKWALMVMPGDPAKRVQVVPTGIGQARTLHWDGFNPVWATWFPDSKHILIVAPGPNVSTFETDMDGAALQPMVIVTGSPAIISPDGKFIYGLLYDKWLLRSLDGSVTKPTTNLPPGETPVTWTEDPAFIYTQKGEGVATAVYRHELATGRDELWQLIKPKDEAGLRTGLSGSGTGQISMTHDGKVMVFNCAVELSELYVSSPIH